LEASLKASEPRRDLGVICVFWPVNIKTSKQSLTGLAVLSGLVYTAFYQQIELELRKTNNPWPKTIGIDEHSFILNVKGAGREFVTVFIDYTNKRMKDVVMGKSLQALKSSSIADIKERENVKMLFSICLQPSEALLKSFFQTRS
jgi:hypothetical protein